MVSDIYSSTPEEFTAQYRASLWVRQHIAQFEKDGGGAALDSIASYAATLDVAADSADFATYAKLRADRWAQRRTVRRVLRGTRPGKCGFEINKCAGKGVYWDAEHGSRISGLQSCGSVWVCPVCNHKIQAGRFDEVKRLMDFCKAHDYGVVFGTLTVRHKRADSLKDVIKMAQEVWRKSRSHRRIKDLFSRTHEVGYLRAMEVTYSHANGWHVHFHCYYVFDHVLGESEAADFSGAYAAEWVETARRCGYAAPLARNQRFEVVDLSKVSSIEAAAKYCTISKTATTPQTSKLGHELTNTQSKVGKVKRHANGRDVLHLTYWDFIRILENEHNVKYRTLSALLPELAKEGYSFAEIRGLAKEYYKATKGCRALIWSRGLRDMAGLGQELSDEELAAQDFANGDAYRLTIFDYAAHVQRREWLMPLMFALMDATQGNLPLLMDFLEWHQVPFKVFDRSDCGDTPPKKKNGGGQRQH